MTKSKNTKRALLMSALSMMLCIAMLAGTTFAWFTDSVTSGMNKIVAGNLDIELEYATEFNKDGTVKTWTPVDPEKPLFSGVEKDGVPTNLWEPGHTEYVCLRVRNAGTLALKYLFSINVFGDENGRAENEYTNVYNKPFKLSSYLVFNQTEGAKKADKREALWLENADAERKELEQKTEDRLAALGGKGVLLPGATEDMTLAVYMPTQVGNEANQLTSAREKEGAPTIYLGLNVQATQTPHESDSFDNTYDVPADGTDKVPAVVPVNPEGDTIISHKNVSVTVPHDATAADTLVLVIKELTGHPKGIVVDTDKQTVQAYDISLKGLKSDNKELIKVELSVEKGLKNVKLYHYTDEVESANYDSATGIITFTTTSFSPFTVVYDTPAVIDTNGTKYTPSEPDEDGKLTFTPAPVDGEDTPDITFTADPETKELTLTNGMGYSGNVTLPAAITGEDGTVYTLTAIPKNVIGNRLATRANKKIKSVEIPDTVKSIGDYAFSNCTNLESVTIPNGVKSIGEDAFYDCTNLKSVTIPSSVTTISSGAFGYTSITEVTIPESLEELPAIVFCGCDKLTTVNLPNSVTKIGDGAFYDCTALTSIEIPNSVTFIDTEAFSGSGLESVTIPASVTTIAGNAFSGCASLKHLVIPNTAEMGEIKSFQGCTALEWIAMPADLIPYQTATYMNCNALKAIYLYKENLESEFDSNGEINGWEKLGSSFNSQYLKAAKYLYSATKPEATTKPTVTVYKWKGSSNPETHQVEYWYWHMENGVPTPWPDPVPAV